MFQAIMQWFRRESAASVSAEVPFRVAQARLGTIILPEFGVLSDFLAGKNIPSEVEDYLLANAGHWVTGVRLGELLAKPIMQLRQEGWIMQEEADNYCRVCFYAIPEILTLTLPEMGREGIDAFVGDLGEGFLVCSQAQEVIRQAAGRDF